MNTKANETLIDPFGAQFTASCSLAVLHTLLASNNAIKLGFPSPLVVGAITAVLSLSARRCKLIKSVWGKKGGFDGLLSAITVRSRLCPGWHNYRVVP